MTQVDGLSYNIYDRLSKMFVKGIWNFWLFGANKYEKLLCYFFDD